METATESQDTKTDHVEVDLEEALNLAGTGKYQLFHCTLMWAALATSLLEMISYTFVLPAAACDLEMPEYLRGLISSIPNIGIIITAPFWGRISDFWGRKPSLLLSSAGAGIISLVAAFMPNLISFGICKFIGALFLSCPSSLSYAYAGEMVPQKRRDFAILVCNGFLTLSTIFTPLLGWGVLSFDWQQIMGIRSWRLLTIVYALPLILTALWLTQAKESPKFLVAKGKNQEALKVLKHIYTKNTGMSPDSYKVTSLKSEQNDRDTIQYGSEVQLTSEAKNDSATALLRPPHLKWFTLIAFLMFGLYTLLNGIFLFATDTINKVLRQPSDEKGTLCILINQPENETSTDTCIDTISQDTFIIMVVTTLIYAIIVVVASMSPLSKKTLLVGMYVTTGTACLLAGLLTNRIVAGGAMSAFQMTALGIGPLTAYAVQLFPTTLRGTAVGAILMFGRIGSVTGANVAGTMLANACTATFYGFASLIFLCAALSFLLPKDQDSKSSSNNNLDTDNVADR